MSDYRSTTIKADDIKDIPTNPIFDGLPNELKNVKAFDKIEKDILKIMYSDHKHRKPSAFLKCKRCQSKMTKKREYIKDKGFKSYEQYLTWKRVINLIKSKDEIK